ncbi:hypothetical protein LTR53_004846 [Teratosphaeriaceae sp. CCFEE 6253]|nr:hypothetical protein LTR53_004846 [Teratosphaeriaceae sp. CCFEE 6253]
MTSTPASQRPSRAPSPLPPAPEDLTLPRILCLHGGGVTAEIFRLQSRSLIKYLPAFRLDYGPFRRWLRWLPEHPAIDDESAVEEVFYNIKTAKDGDEGTGPWVGMLGFSQGAKLASSLLYEQQVHIEKEGKAETDYKFAVLLAGRSPIVSFSDRSRSDATVAAGAISEGFHYEGASPHVLRLPTIHVHGLNDAGLHLHRKMLRQYHDPSAVTVIEWDGTHRVPIKKTDVEPIAAAIYKVAREQGVDV